MRFQRSTGVLLHISSLPSYGGIGDLGPEAYNFLDFLAAAKQHIWQVLPLCPTGYGNSPYAGSSAFAGNPYLISLEFLADWGWITVDRIANLAGRGGNVDFDDVENPQAPAPLRSRPQLPRTRPNEDRFSRPMAALHRLLHRRGSLLAQRLRLLRRPPPPLQDRRMDRLA
jgi:4-alpha-glucanotransferase